MSALFTELKRVHYWYMDVYMCSYCSDLYKYLNVCRLYRSLKELAETKLLDGTGRKPHYRYRICSDVSFTV